MPSHENEASPRWGDSEVPRSVAVARPVERGAVLIRPGQPSDAPALAEFVVMASEGLALRFWAAAAGPGETPLDVGRRRAARDEGAFSWRNAWVAERQGQVLAGLVGYRLPDRPEPVGPELPAEFAPLQELENEGPGSWYINVLATLPGHRGHGLGTRLLGMASETAVRAGATGLSLIVASGNRGAIRLYEREGFAVRASRPVAGPASDGSRWLLLTRAA